MEEFEVMELDKRIEKLKLIEEMKDLNNMEKSILVEIFERCDRFFKWNTERLKEGILELYREVEMPLFVCITVNEDESACDMSIVTDYDDTDEESDEYDISKSFEYSIDESLGEYGLEELVQELIDEMIDFLIEIDRY